MNSDIETEKFNKGGIVTETKEGRQVVRVILGSVYGREFSLAENVTVDTTSNVREFGNPVEYYKLRLIIYKPYNPQIHRIFEGRSPVLLFRDTILICFGKCRVVIQLMDVEYRSLYEMNISYSSDSQTKLAHGVKGWWASVQNFLDEFGDGRARGPIF